MACAVGAALAFVLGAPLASAATWQVDPQASKLTFHGSMGGQGFDGAFRRWSAQIDFDPKALATSKVVVSIDTASAATGDPDRDQALPTPDWFSAQAFPKATFTSRTFKDLGGDRYQVVGDLTLRGATRPLTLPITLAITGDVAKANGQVAVNRLDFGVGQGRWKNTDVVAPAVTVGVALVAHRVK
jgi:polyisoprenoid-binding protein YceI